MHNIQSLEEKPTPSRSLLQNTPIDYDAKTVSSKRLKFMLAQDLEMSKKSYIKLVLDPKDNKKHSK